MMIKTAKNYHDAKILVIKLLQEDSFNNFNQKWKISSKRTLDETVMSFYRHRWIA